MNILSIGNSFSQDAQRYAHRIAKCDNCNLDTVNLFIGGCSLEKHYGNILSDTRCYEIQYNGENTGFLTTINDALLNRHWDYITIQQVSHKSINYETYEPYLSYIAEYIRKYCPKTKIVLHQTWAYEDESDRLTNELGYDNYKSMLSDIVEANDAAFKAIKADGIIRSGNLFDLLLERGIKSIHRDTFHASLGIGRYALGLLWYGYLTGKEIDSNTFSDFDEEVSKEHIDIIKQCVNEVLEDN